MQKWVKGGGKSALLLQLRLMWRQKGGVGIRVDPPVTVVLDTGDFRVALMVVMMATAAIFCKTALALTRAIATIKSAVAIELPPLRMNFLFRCREERVPPKTL